MDETRSVNGIEVHIEGSGAEAVLLLHGWPDTHRLWDAQVEHLRARYRCIRFTLPGFDAAQPRRAHSLAELVATLRHVVQHTCPGQQVTLLLHDWGCVFGYEFAMRHPELVQRIVGVDIGDAGSRAHRQALTTKAKWMVFAYQAWLALAWVIGGHVNAALGDRMTRWMARLLRCRSDARFIGSQMNYPYLIAWTGAHGSYRRALRFDPRCPMLYLWGRKKPFQFHSVQWVEALRARPGCRALEFDTGHWLMTAQPRAFNEAVAAWLDETSAAAAAGDDPRPTGAPAATG
jgi:pimeloyl-ACP methyl ester carboxylesterase